jgi:hypothetical protein
MRMGDVAGKILSGSNLGYSYALIADAFKLGS